MPGPDQGLAGLPPLRLEPPFRPRYGRGETRGTLVSTIIYKICPAALWGDAERTKIFRGSPVDQQDGYIHFSTAEQVEATLAKHFAGQKNLLLIAVDAEALGAALKWEPSRGGALFPHLHGVLPLSAAQSVKPIAGGADQADGAPELLA
jgi:uncharacterized protein (DUF952 family)